MCSKAIIPELPAIFLKITNRAGDACLKKVLFQLPRVKYLKADWLSHIIKDIIVECVSPPHIYPQCVYPTLALLVLNTCTVYGVVYREENVVVK